MLIEVSWTHLPNAEGSQNQHDSALVSSQKALGLHAYVAVGPLVQNDRRLLAHRLWILQQKLLTAQRGQLYMMASGRPLLAHCQLPHPV